MPLSTTARPTPTPWSYFLIRLLFKFVLKVFYGTIVIEGQELIPEDGQACIVCANHANSLTDALLLVTAIPSKKRGLLRLTAKATQFGKRTFTSWLIESAGTVPIQRPRDMPDGMVDNTAVMEKLREALEKGDAVCVFPEGASRYHPTIAPLKTGVARLVSDVLTQKKDEPEFEVSIMTASVTYMHRQHWRSDVLITFHPPLRFRPKDNPELIAPVDYSCIRNVTAQMHQQITSGTLDSPSWELIRVAKLAARIYVPLGTMMSLGDYVRVVRTFLEAFKLPLNPDKHGPRGRSDSMSGSGGSADEGSGDVVQEQDARLIALCNDLKAYQERLSRWHIKDDRVRRPLRKREIIRRLFVRFCIALSLFTISLPGLLLWLPVMLTTFYAVHNFKKTGPIWDTWDEIAQYKLIYGLLSGLGVWLGATLLTFPLAPITFFAIPATMWLSLRWTEDAISSVRAALALARMLRVGKPALAEMRRTREELHARVMDLATVLGLPQDPERYFAVRGGTEGEKGRMRSKWDSRVRYFSVRRRRKRDWEEILRLYDKQD
ncbi:hypothetical protein PUNSTDRAFT_142218 [Punctularia strigosozonata HHB-11173 SS5]|uniref:uncharacterized protein n=1 Tax=Punctularia strigosozonata (strain HHB-11173) TaxID=741275 RepID=UPI0004416D30|nr:uncharacterized protein PUNSTDRAFT_142218 [Punctularia strigosozonata HHB-11173 SS5]EIN12064.1 hypothetical protein PUNSTDRAFT_142218 [Punctularia strigosozonata HHB-11173 SS5]